MSKMSAVSDLVADYTDPMIYRCWRVPPLLIVSYAEAEQDDLKMYRYLVWQG